MSTEQSDAQSWEEKKFLKEMELREQELVVAELRLKSDNRRNLQKNQYPGKPQRFTIKKYREKIFCINNTCHNNTINQKKRCTLCTMWILYFRN